jgi:hypothetical protein
VDALQTDGPGLAKNAVLVALGDIATEQMPHRGASRDSRVGFRRKTGAGLGGFGVCYRP